MRSAAKRAPDRRVRNTLQSLREALTDLIREKEYNAISVQEILDRANVGRSTFYMHFRDKDELLVSGIREMLGSAPPMVAVSARHYQKLVGFGLPIFEYHYHHVREGKAHMGHRGRAALHEYLQRALTEWLVDAFGKELHRRRGASKIPPDLLINYVASTFVLVLNWWVESKNPLPPQQVNELFRSLVLPTLEAVYG
jgi:AcrR family transcriptional regulator